MNKISLNKEIESIKRNETEMLELEKERIEKFKGA